MAGSNCMCLWNKLSKEKSSLINYKYFWGKAIYDECSIREKPKPLSQRLRRMYCTLNLIFASDGNNYILTIGIDPIKKFEVLFRFEHENTGVYIEMNTSNIYQLYAVLHQTFHTTPRTSTSVDVNYVNKTTKIDVKLFHHDTYKLSIMNKTIFIPMDALLELLENEAYIRVLIKKYEIKAILYGNTVFKLLKLCCHYLQSGNKVRNYYAIDNSSKSSDSGSIILAVNNRTLKDKFNISEVLDELLLSPCDCLSTTFVIETKVHFQELILFWLGAYYETRLLAEVIRNNTFKKTWPHKHIEPKKLAESGFFYVGPFDRVQCVFCKTVLEKWEPYDDVKGEHERFAPNCPLLMEAAAENIPLNSFEKLFVSKNKDDGAGKKPLLDYSIYNLL